ncbi:MAG: hypothetical protein KAV87_14470, partial [Desulfobacteraceae bacterium]|nr:hypothetical protein [Desulfobacteraceae bacterium]
MAHRLLSLAAIDLLNPVDVLGLHELLVSLLQQGVPVGLGLDLLGLDPYVADYLVFLLHEDI